MPKLRVIKNIDGGNKSSSTYNKSLYTSWGDEADNAHGQGWYPETDKPDFNGNLTFKSKYDLFNKVEIPNQKDLGHVAVIGNNKGMSIVVRDAGGKIVKTVLSNLTPKDVQAYFTNQQSLVNQRANSIQQGTNIDRPDTKGTFAAY